MIGQTLGHFRILERLGSGGMGVVYRAHDEKLQRLIAIKVVGRDTGTPEVDRLRIIEEARAASGLSHPNICTVYETGDFDGQAYIAMEYVEGRALSELIPPEGLPPETVLRYGVQIADALAHAHRRGVIHRDLKTANVVISSDGRAKVLDFGLARRIPLDVGSALTRSSNAIGDGKLVGTLAYMAPETLLGQTSDERGDIWGLGVMLHEMAAGELPFRGRNEFEITAGILRTAPHPLPAHVPPMLRAIIQRCLAKDQAQRYQQVVEVRAALEAIQSDVFTPLQLSDPEHLTGSVEAPPSGSHTRPIELKPRRSVAWLVAAPLVLVVAGAALWLSRDTRSPWERVAANGRLTLLAAFDDPVIDPAISPDGKMVAYVVQDKSGGTDVFVRRTAGGSPVQITNDAARESSPRFSPDGDRIAFMRRESADGTPEVRIVPALGGDMVASIANANAPRWSPEGKRLAFLRPIAGGTQVVVAGVDGSNPRVVLEPDSAYPFLRDPAWSTDGDEMAIVRGSGGISGEIWLVPSGGGAPRRAMTDPAEVFSDSPVYTADGQGIVHSSNRGGATNIWFYPRRGGVPVRLTAGPGPDSSPTTSADGTIVFNNSRWRNTLDLYSLRGGQPRVLTTHSPFIWGPAFSRDGNTIAFSRSEVDGSWHIWSIPAEGGTPRRLTDTPNGEVYSRFSPDGSFVLFHTWSTPRRIGRVAASGGIPRMLSFGDASDSFPDMSPNGRLIAFSRIDADAERVYIGPADGGTARRLTSAASAVPRWSPDGRTIAFSANRSYSGGIFVIDAEGRGEKRLTSVGGWPVWFPDGRQIAYIISGRDGNQEIHVVSRDGGATRKLIDIPFPGLNYPFDIAQDGTRLATSNAVHVSDEIWLLEPRARQ
jgi:eukaryotic-like serine/threonine-protein kinase